ncbi:MAG: sigma-70 family RNA polymerase sigma factor [Burkholderiaceae bacterium]
MDIGSIIGRVQRGEHDAFASIVERYQSPLFGYLWRLGLDRSRAEDIAQETFVRAWRGLDGFRSERAAFSTWLFAIARNLAFDSLSTSARDPASVSVEDMPQATDLAHPGADPATRFEQGREFERLHAALRRLPVAERGALALAVIGGFPLAEVARIEGASLAAIKVRIHRGRARLRALLDDQADAAHGSGPETTEYDDDR